jgi:uncharacterized protein YggE
MQESEYSRSYNAAIFGGRMRKLVTAVVTLVLCSGVLWAQTDDGQRRILVNTVSVGADGKFEAAPDTALLSFTIAAQDGSSEAAYTKAAAAADRIRQVLRANGIDPKAAEIGVYSLQPVYDWKSPKRKIVAYRVTASATLKIKDFSKVGPVTQGLAPIEETENQSIGYTLENIDSAKQKAIEDALGKAKASAATVARVGGRTLGDLAYAAVDTFEQQPPVPLYATAKAMRGEAAQAAPPTEEFTPQKVTVTAHVNAIFNLK